MQPAYEGFRVERVRRHWYEIICNTLGKWLFKIPLNEKTIKDLSEKIEFCDLDIEPNSVYSTCIVTTIIGVIFGIVLFLLGFPIYGMVATGAAIGLAIYFFYYPSVLTRYYRIKASSELVLSILYMVVSLRLVPNLENAVKFAANNLKGPVGRDLKKMLWDLSVGKYLSVGDLLDIYAKKWKEENEEFYQAMDMIKTSMMEHGEKRERMLDESINVILKGNMERMKSYSSQLRNPLMIITMFGVTLPILTIILFPILTVFMTEVIKPVMLVVFYNIILPVIVYWIMSDVLRSMPLQFSVVDISLHPDAHPVGQYYIKLNNRRIKLPLLLIAVLIGMSVVGVGYYISSISAEGAVTLTKIAGGIIILWGIATMLIFYSFFSYYKNIEIRDEIREIEAEFGDTMFQLGHILYTGQPMEKSLEKLYESSREQKMGKFFKRALDNIRSFGFTVKKAFFDEKVGVARYYPSHMIRNILRILVDSIEKGVAGAAKTMIAISQYLKSVHLVEQHMREVLDETTSNMKFMLSMLAPIACGIVVGMATIMVMVLYQIVSIMSSVTGLSTTVPSLATPGLLESLVDIKNIVPAEIFLVIVGAYMLEVIILLSIFLATLEHGGDSLDKYSLITNGTLIGMTIFSFSILLIYFIFSGIISMVWPA